MTNTSYYDSIASGYNELHKEEQMNKIKIIVRELKKRMNNNNDNNNDNPLVDVGCGTGFSLDMFAESTGFSCFGVEPSSGMVKEYSGKQELLVSPAENLPFPDNFASVCVSITAIQNFDDISKGISEMIRITKEGAPIIISCLKKSSKLGEIAEILGDILIVEEAIEEEKDIIFVCLNNKLVKEESEE